MKKISVRTQDGRLLLRVTVNKTPYSKCWGDASDPMDREHMLYVAREATREINRGVFEGFDKWFKINDSISKQGIIQSLESKYPGHNRLAVLKHLRAYDGPIHSENHLHDFFDSLTLEAPTKARYLSEIRKVVPSICKNIRFSQSSGHPDPFSGLEVDYLLKHCHQFKINNPMLDLWFDTGLRTGEMSAFSLDWIDWDNSALVVKGSYSHRYKRISECKSGKNRIIKLSDHALNCLKSINEPSDKCLFKELRYISNFCNRKWRPLLNHLQIRYRKPYCIRHTVATQKIKSYSGDLARVAYEMGHRVDTLAEFYAGYINLLK